MEQPLLHRRATRVHPGRDESRETLLPSPHGPAATRDSRPSPSPARPSRARPAASSFVAWAIPRARFVQGRAFALAGTIPHPQPKRQPAAPPTGGKRHSRGSWENLRRIWKDVGDGRKTIAEATAEVMAATPEAKGVGKHGSPVPDRERHLARHAFVLAGHCPMELFAKVSNPPRRVLVGVLKRP